MIDRNRLIKGCVIMAGLFTMLAFASWRVQKSSWDSMKYVAMNLEAESEAESAELESEKKAEYEATAPKSMTISITEAPSIEPTMPSIIFETETEMPYIASESPTTHETKLDVQVIVQSEEMPTTPVVVPNTANILMTSEEEQLIMRVASCEAGNQGWIGMALVMRVVLNRSQAWGMSISDVIYAKGQFSVIGCDKWNSGFIAEEAPIALQAVKDGWDGSQGALFFCAPSGRSEWMATTKQYLFTGWGHEFYK